MLRKYVYNEGIHDRLRLESVTPMALNRLFRNMNYVFSHLNLW